MKCRDCRNSIKEDTSINVWKNSNQGVEEFRLCLECFKTYGQNKNGQETKKAESDL